MPKVYFFPEMITKLPEADIPIEGVQLHLIQSKDQQFIFFPSIRTRVSGEWFWMVKLN